MDSYIEQSVSGEKSYGKSVLYGFCWCAAALLLIPAMFFGAGVFGNNRDALEINWLNVILLFICLSSAFAVFRWKDRLRMEYDYTLRGTILEISGIFNAQRRRRLEEIPLERILQIGPANGTEVLKQFNNPQFKRHNWFLNANVRKYYITYKKENIGHIAILEFNDEMIVAIRKSGALSRGAWRNEEGKTSDYASLS